MTVECDEIAAWLASDDNDPGVQMLTDSEYCDLVSLKALCHDIRLDCFVIASLVANSQLPWVMEVTWRVV